MKNQDDGTLSLFDDFPPAPTITPAKETAPEIPPVDQGTQVETTLHLAGLVEHVTLIEFAEQLKADAVLVNKLKSLPNVTIHANAQTTEITGDGSKVNGLNYKDRANEAVHHVELAGVFVQIGLIPNTEFLKGTLALSKFGEIEVDAKGHTSLPGVFAAGDCTTVPYKQIIIAASEGSKAALSAFDYLIRQPVSA
jgi:alkyl hydroperoxide reductase subunit F